MAAPEWEYVVERSWKGFDCSLNVEEKWTVQCRDVGLETPRKWCP